MRYLQYVERFVDGMKVVEIPDHADGPVFFCMHGYGANAYDLAGLSQYLNFPAGTRYLFPDGILKIDLGYAAGYEGRAWFPIDWQEIERIRREGGLRDLSKTLPAGMAEAHDRIIDAMHKLECAPGKTVIGGFSQGAMLATEIALHHKEYLAGLLIFSGTLVNRTGWESMLKTKFVDKQKTLRFHQSHGRQDPVLPFQAAERLYELLTKNGGQGELHAFEGQHEIPAAVIDTTNRWLGALFS
jgi:phospholipase/carboxylesterase